MRGKNSEKDDNRRGTETDCAESFLPHWDAQTRRRDQSHSHILVELSVQQGVGVICSHLPKELV